MASSALPQYPHWVYAPPRSPSCPVPGSPGLSLSLQCPHTEATQKVLEQRLHLDRRGFGVSLLEMSPLTWGLRGCVRTTVDSKDRASLILPVQLDSVLEVEHRGSTHLRTPDPCDAKETPTRKEAVQTNQAQMEPGGLGSRLPRCQTRAQCLSQNSFLVPAGAQGS